MGIKKKINDITGTVLVEIEGYFTERYINLCRIQNVKIWEIKQIVPGVTRFKIHISEFKKLRPITRKTKCKLKIKQKRGMYFKMFKYRKRKIAIVLIAIMLLFLIVLSNRVWKIEITGNENISNSEITEILNNSGLYIGKSKHKFNTRQITDKFRANITGVSWIGIELKGTTAYVKVIEKEVLDEKYIQDDNTFGNIIANKSGVLTKIIAENGTARYKEGSYIEEGTILIEGIIESTIVEAKQVHAKGIVYINRECTYEKEYLYKNIIREYTNKKRYTIGFSVNNKENMLNYLNKNKKYDINKKENALDLFGQKFSFDIYLAKEYIEKEIIYSKDEILNKAKEGYNNYINNELIPSLDDAKIVSNNVQVIEEEEKVIFKVTYVVNERIGKFLSSNTSDFHINNIN